MTQLELLKVIDQDNLDKELTRHSLFYWLEPKDMDVKNILVKKGFLEKSSNSNECKLTLKGSSERAKAEKRLESVGRKI